MNFIEKMRDVGSSIRDLKESLTIHDPRRNSPDDINSFTADLQGERRIKPVNLKGGRIDPRVYEAAKLMRDVYTGRKPMYLLKEAMTTADFPNLFGDVLYRQLLGNYTPYPVTYPGYFRIVKAPDFRTLHMYALDGGQSLMTTSLKEREPYPEVSFTETAYTAAVAKYGRRYGITFEMLKNDDLNAFQQRPALMAVGARRSEEYLATTMFVDANGPHASFFTAGNNNIIPSNPILSIQGLQAGMKRLAAQKDADGQPIVITAFALVVTPALKITAENIMNATQIRVNDNTSGPGGGTAGQFIYTENWMKGYTQLYVNPYIPYIASSANADTSWFLIANPNDLGTRPAFVFIKLNGYEDPQLFLKSPNSQLIGGGMVGALEGDFDSDAIDYKLRTFFGAAQIDPKMAVSSNGSGS